ncbi:ankyrin repeat domain-containing protein [Burkholderia glumae]|uniref:ankyrin repeat domain-containing protein n=1 Tax=Burkholderia glumae TaxID=337 RepID=UPI000478511F|nr:ankyrin repeat domain-containing protein [Burkholderia glumae]PJO24280.1 hypothetical protein Y5A_003865 [Burkholderia glumae AU6208]QHE11531.1 hypothetical protein GQR88_14630 [Burkholderia glumae AU6208]
MKGTAIEIAETLDREVARAACGGDAKRLADLLRRGGGVATVDEEGWTTLMRATASGSERCVRALLGLVDPMAKSRDGETALMIAASMGWGEGVGLLLDAIASGPQGPERKRKALGHRSAAGKTPLILAAKASEPACVEKLLALSNPNAVDLSGRTAVMWAARGCGGKAVECVRMLARASDVSIVDRNGWSALHFAAAEGGAECVDILAPLFDSIADGGCASVWDVARERGGEQGECIREALRRAMAQREGAELCSVVEGGRASHGPLSL